MKKPMKMTKGSKAKMGPASKMPVAKDMGSMMLAKGGKAKMGPASKMPVAKGGKAKMGPASKMPVAKGGKVKSRRYADGDLVTTDTDVPDLAPTDTSKFKVDTPSKPSTPSFGAAFKAARAAGKDGFTWNGKKYSTARADDNPAAKPSSSTPAAKPAAMDTRAIATKAAAAYDAKEAAKKPKNPIMQMLESSAASSNARAKREGNTVDWRSQKYARGGGIESRGKTRGKFI